MRPVSASVSSSAASVRYPRSSTFNKLVAHERLAFRGSRRHASDDCALGPGGAAPDKDQGVPGKRLGKLPDKYLTTTRQGGYKAPLMYSNKCYFLVSPLFEKKCSFPEFRNKMFFSESPQSSTWSQRATCRAH